MKEKRVYIDTDIFVYVALKHPDYYKKCYSVLELLTLKEFTGYGSQLVLFELYGALSKLNVEAAYEAVKSYLNLPLTILEVNRDTFRYAKEIAALTGITYDSIHAALVAQNNIDVVVTEDLKDWHKILRVWPKIKEKLNTRELIVLSPTKGRIKA